MRRLMRRSEQAGERNWNRALISLGLYRTENQEHENVTFAVKRNENEQHVIEEQSMHFKFANFD